MEPPVLIITVLLSVLCNADDKIKEKKCNLAFKCSLDEDPVWATDCKNCYVSRNGCHLASENCNRENSNKPVLKVITQDKCQVLCDQNCPKFKKPICGLYREEKRQFDNRCFMNYYICKTGKTFMIENEGPCFESIILPTN